MTTLPPLPAENEDPWWEKRKEFDLAVKELLENGSSPEMIQSLFSATLKLAMFESIGDLIVGSDADGGAAAILPRGLDGQILQVNTLQPLGLEWSDRLTQAQSEAQAAINLATQTAIEAVRSVITEYAVNSSETVAPTTGWSTDQPARTPGTYIWYRTITTKGPIEDEEVITSAPALLTGNTGAQGIPGEQGPTGPTGSTGAAGKGVSTTEVRYQVHTSGTVAPTGTWVSSPPATTTGQFLWTRTVITYTDATTSTSYSVAAHGSTGATGAPGAAGRGVSSTAVTYQKHTNGTTAPTGSWVGSPPATSPGEFLWTRLIITYTDSTTTTSYSVSAHGATGASGPTGPAGADGSDGVDGNGIASSSVSYQKHTNGTTAPTGTWLGSPPATSAGEFLWTRVVLTYTDSSTTTSYSVAAHGATGATGAQGDQGPQGPAGKGVSGSTVTYQASSSGTSVPGGSWLSSPPATTPGQFLWTRTVITYTDASTSTSYSIAAHGATGPTGPAGADGADGIDGDDGLPGKGIASTEIRYQAGSSATTAPTGTWLTTPPTTTPGQFLWTRTVFSYTDATSSTAYAVAAHGATGSTGATGAAGRGISSTAVTYQASSSGTVVPTGTWVGSPPATTPGQFLWSRTVITYTDATTSTAYSVALHGATGATGAAGRGISSSVTTYQAGSSGTSVPGGTWVSSPPATTPGQFLWSRTIVTYTDATTSTSYSVAAHGATGATGATGTGVSSVTPYFLQQGTGGSTPAKPTLNPPGGSWSLTEPGYTSSTELFRTELVIYSNGSFAYTNVSKVSSYTASTQAVTAANLAQAAAEGLLKASMTDPGHAVGRLWLVLNGSGDTIGIKISNGSAWSSYAIMADQILVPGSVGPTQIANGAITTVKLDATAINGMTVTGATIQTTATANRGVKIDSSGFNAYSNTGVKTVEIVASTGSVTLGGSASLTGTITASGVNTASVGFIAHDTTNNLSSMLRPRGLEFIDPAGSQTIRLNTKKISTGDPVVPGVIQLTLEDPDGNEAITISKYTVGGTGYGVKFSRRVMFNGFEPILQASAVAGHFYVRSGTSTIYPIRGFYTGYAPWNLPAASAANIVSGDIAITAYESSTSRDPGHGMYGYFNNTWSLVDLHIKPVFVTNGYEGSSAQSISAATWTLVNSVLGTPITNRAFTSWTGGALRIKEPGVYLVSMSSFLLSNTGVHNIRVTRNSTSPGTDADSVVSSNGTGPLNSAMRIAVLNADDYLRFYAYSATATQIRNLPQTNFCVTWLAPL